MCIKKSCTSCDTQWALSLAQLPAELGAKLMPAVSKVARGVQALPDVKGYNILNNNGRVRALILTAVHSCRSG